MNKTKTFLIAVAVMSLMACGGNKTERKAEPVAVETETVKTGMTEGLDEEALKQQIPMRRFGTPQEVADAVAFLVSPQAGYITGNVISINGGLYT